MHSAHLHLPLTDPDSFARSSIEAVDLVHGVIQARKWVKSVSAPLVRYAAYALSIPLFPFGYAFIYFTLVAYNRKLKKVCNPDIKLDTSNYKKIRSIYDRLDAPVTKINTIKLPSAKAIPWYLRPIGGQILRLIRTVRNYHGALKANFDKYDTPMSPLQPGWKIVTGTEMYQSRVKGYEYLV